MPIGRISIMAINHCRTDARMISFLWPDRSGQPEGAKEIGLDSGALAAMMDLRNLRGIIHIGANTGQEAKQYAARRLNVLWIEPIPNLYEELKANIAPYPRQQALNYLVGDEDNKPVAMHVCNNEGLSSSIFDMDMHQKMYPNVAFNYDIECIMWTLDTIVERENIDVARRFDGMVIDVQGAELLVLKGAKQTLDKMKRLQVESANFSLYKNYPTAQDLGQIANSHGLTERTRNVFNDFREHGAQCFDIVYSR